MLTNKQYIGVIGVIAAVSIIGLWLDRNTTSSTNDDLVGEEYEINNVRRLLAAGSLTELQEPPPVSLIYFILCRMFIYCCISMMRILLIWSYHMHML